MTSRQLEHSAGAIELLERGNRRYPTIVARVRKELVDDPSPHPVIIPSEPLG